MNQRLKLNQSNDDRVVSKYFLYAFAILGFVVLAVFAHFNSHFTWDLPIQHIVLGIDLPYFADLMRLVSAIANGHTPHYIAMATSLVFLLLRHWRESVGIMIATLGGGVSNVLVKLVVARPRPIDDPDIFFMSFDATSFPSGHVTFFVCYFGFLVFVACAQRRVSSRLRPLGLSLLFIPLFLIGLSRVFLQAHYPSDTFGGYILGGLWLSATLWLYGRLRYINTIQDLGAALHLRTSKNSRVFRH